MLHPYPQDLSHRNYAKSTIKHADPFSVFSEHARLTHTASQCLCKIAVKCHKTFYQIRSIPPSTNHALQSSYSLQNQAVLYETQFQPRLSCHLFQIGYTNVVTWQWPQFKKPWLEVYLQHPTPTRDDFVSSLTTHNTHLIKRNSYSEQLVQYSKP